MHLRVGCEIRLLLFSSGLQLTFAACNLGFLSLTRHTWNYCWRCTTNVRASRTVSRCGLCTDGLLESRWSLTTTTSVAKQRQGAYPMQDRWSPP
ncbi:uncharacterized protein B0H18DRAFT_1054488 [Fomitopsis serialis]|uniref:uncharacterized protein n=1 Tax=Fomitopsis serialis TaxID=139415 RepID=UPI0020086A49|nr:uncharacterized protein B0H18DRAFT_1054488 [Neoantrodia serialis]KAH9912368.1 hypothetical protein B0H18DRAFT_1054488 [Neoantrodia serialis]